MMEMKEEGNTDATPVAEPKKTKLGHTGFGRPPKFKQEYCREVIDFMQNGYDLEDFAAKIIVQRKTLYNWAKAYPDFLHAIQIGKVLSRRYWSDLARSAAHGKNMQAKVNGVDTDLTNVNKIQPSALQLTLRNKLGWSNDVNVNVNFRDPLDRILEGEVLEGEEVKDVTSPERIAEIIARYAPVLRITASNKSKRP